MRTTLAIMSVLAVMACNDNNVIPDTGERTYEVTLINTNRGQPLSPAVFIVQDGNLDFFDPGSAASGGLATLAEQGDPAVEVSAVSSNPAVYDVATTSAPIAPVTDQEAAPSAAVTIKATEHYDELSMAAMLICTNDGFVSGRDIVLPEDFQAKEVALTAYDAGSEENSEAASDIVPPCFNLGPVTDPTGGSGHTDEFGTVEPHPGISGDAALTSENDWSGSPALLRIRRIE